MLRPRSWSIAMFVLATTTALAQKPNTAIIHPPEAKSPLARQIANLYGQSLANSPSMLSRDISQTVWRVFYATNRVRLVGEKDRRISYGPVPASPPRLEYGDCEILIPTLRDKGSTTARANAKLSPQSTESKTEVACRQTQPLAYNRFFEELVRTVSQSPQRDVMVYVHGYNVGFEDAVCRAGQLACDLPFNGVVICYSWPTAGTTLSYTKDVENADGTVKHLWRFLSALQSHLGNGTRISLVGHSMGCRALLQGVAGIPKNVRETRPFQHLVLAAPDVGIDTFPSLADKCTVAARHVTLYVSKGDEALLASKSFAPPIQRVGDASRLVIVPQVDTVDVSLVDSSFLGHSYYAANRTVLNELFQLIKLDNPPAQRPWLRATKHEGKIYWQFVDRPPDVMQAERHTLKK